MIYFVKSKGSNFYMNSLLEKMNSNFIFLGLKSESIEMEFPKTKGARYVFVGHEWENENSNIKFPSRRILAKSICLITENPGSPWFLNSLKLIDMFQTFMFINKSSFDAFPVEPKRKFLFQMFNISTGQNFESFEDWSRRRYDFNFTGGLDAHRKVMLGRYAPIFSSSKSKIVCPPTRHRSTPDSQQLSVDELAHTLAETKYLVNFHRENTSSLEWQRVLIAMENGAIVISEDSIDGDNAESLEIVTNIFSSSTLVDPSWNLREQYLFAKNAYERSCELHQFNNSGDLKRFIRRSNSLMVRFLPLRLRKPRLNFALAVTWAYKKLQMFTERFILSHGIVNHQYWMFGNLARGQKHLVLANIDLKRSLERMNFQKTSIQNAELIMDKRATVKPEISIVIPIFREGKILERTLLSIQEAEIEVEFEVLVCSDAGDSDTLEIAVSFLQNSNLSCAVYKNNWNFGVGATRNMLLREARGKYALILDGDNSLYPCGLKTLYEGIIKSENAFFAYGILTVEENNSEVDLMSFMKWDRYLFAEIGNYIDALSLVNVDKVLKIGGYSEALPLYGWEDFDLWARIAEEGGVGVFVENFVAVYLKRPGSMIGLTNIDQQDAWALIKSHSPSLWMTQ
jgi:hypothetical protein